MIKRPFLRSAALALACLAVAAPARADMHATPPAQIEVLPGWRQADGSHMAALHVHLEPGWKTYWRAPGDAGIPPHIDWTGSQNIAEVQFRWPVPEVFDTNGMTTLGYASELVLPMLVLPVDPTADMTVEASLLIGVCEDICMPMEAELTAVLATTPTDADGAITRALDLRPDTADEAGVVSTTCTIAPIDDGVRVTAEIEMPALAAAEFAVIEPGDRAIWVSEAMTHRDGARLVAVADMVAPDAEPFELDPTRLRLTVLGAGRAVDITGCDPAQ